MMVMLEHHQGLTTDQLHSEAEVVVVFGGDLLEDQAEILGYFLLVRKVRQVQGTTFLVSNEQHAQQAQDPLD